MARFRPGQWVTYTIPESTLAIGSPVRGLIHKTALGRFVGIYQPAGNDPLDRSVSIPEHVVPVRPSGENVRVPDHDGQMFVRVEFSPSQLADIQPMLDLGDMPPGRVVAPGWTPRP